MKVKIFNKAKKSNNILTNSQSASDDSYNSRENFELNNNSNLWKLYSMFRLKALEMTIPMVYHTYIYH